MADADFDFDKYISANSGGSPKAAAAAAPSFDFDSYIDKHAPEQRPAPEPDDQGGLVGKFYRGYSELAQNSHSPVMKMIDFAGRGAAEASRVGGNFVRSYALGETTDKDTGQKRGLTGDEYLEKKGWSKGPGVTIPAKTLLGRDIEVNPRSATGAAIDIATDPVTWAMMGEKPAAGLAEKAAPEVINTVNQKVAKVVANIPEETSARYIADAEPIRNAPASSDISDRLTALAKQTKDAVDSAAEDHKGAKEALKDATSNASSAEKDAATKAGFEVDQQRLDAKDALRDAQGKYDQSAQQLKEAVRDHHLGALTGSAVNAVSDLKTKVSEASGAGYKILENKKGFVDTKPFVDGLQEFHDDQFVNGVPKSPQAESTANEIKSWQDRLQKMTEKSGGQLTLPQSKEMMQELDKVTQYAPDAGGFSDKTNAALKDLRKNINDSVREQSPEYAAHQDKVVAPMTRLLSKANDLYGTPEKAVSNLNNLVTPKGETINLPVLRAVSDMTNSGLRGSVEDYLNAKNIQRSGTKFEELMSKTPQASDVAKKQAILDDLTHPEYKPGQVEKARTNAAATSAPDIVSAETGVEQKGQALEAAQGRQKLMSGITPDTVTRKQMALKNPSQTYGAEKRFSAIDKEFGTNFQKEVQARNDADYFSKEVTNGSRMTNLGKALGTGVGYVFGKESGAIVGHAAGAAVGAASDKYATRAAQWMLDNGIETSEGIKNLAKDIKNTPVAPQLIGSLIRSGVMDPRSKGPDKWAADGFVNLMKHADANDRKTLGVSSEYLMKDAKSRDLLVQASSEKPGSKAMQAILDKIKGRKK